MLKRPPAKPKPQKKRGGLGLYVWYRQLSSLLTLSCLIFIFLQFSACSTGHRLAKDGPPPFPVDVSKIRDAVPRCEPKSRYGNNPSYVVWGKRYYVMPSSKGYCETGVASWYGMAFHQRKTSSGERFSTLEMTAAHKSLPLPTYVEVTNLENGKTVIVKVNDRGPFYDDRIIDLSYVAAVKLGVFPKGTAKVRVKAIDPTTYRSKRRRGFFSRDEEESNAVQEAAPVSRSDTKKQKQRATIDEGDIYSDTSPAGACQVKICIGEYRSQQRAKIVARQVYKIVHQHPQLLEEGVGENRRYLVQLGPICDATEKAKMTKKLRESGLID